MGYVKMLNNPFKSPSLLAIHCAKHNPDLLGLQETPFSNLSFSFHIISSFSNNEGKFLIILDTLQCQVVRIVTLPHHENLCDTL